MLEDLTATAWPGNQALKERYVRMEVLLENNPVINRIWNEWIDKDRELSVMTKEERLGCCSDYQWLFPKKKPGKMVELESLYNSVHQKSNRTEFKKWFYVVSGYILSRVHFGDNSYYQYKEIFKKKFKRNTCTSDDFPSQVILVLGLLGYIKELQISYSYTKGGSNNHGYHYLIDKEKLMTWGSAGGFTRTDSVTGIPEWEMTHTFVISFNEEGKDPDKESWKLHKDWLSDRQYETIKSLEVSKDGVEESSRFFFNYDDYHYYYNLSQEKQEKLKEEWDSFQKLRDLDCGIVGGCKDDSVRDDGKQPYAGRFYTTVVNMKSDHRHKYLRLGGELFTEVDVCNAQPTFLGILIYKETGHKGEWLRQCLDGHFYEWVKEITGCPADRKEVKRLMMRYLYQCYQPNRKKDFKGEHTPTKRKNKKDGLYQGFKDRLDEYLIVNEPDIFNKIDYYKRHPIYREDKETYSYYQDESGETRKKRKGTGKWCSMLSFYLVKEEVTFIKYCIKSIPEDTPFITIHDCIGVRESDSLAIKSLMESCSRSLYGEDITLRLKRENTSEDYS